MSPRALVYLRFLAVFVVLGGLGLGGSAYILVQQGTPSPFRDVYELEAEFTAADGVVEGIGQPVNVAGVKVGQVVGARLADGRALLTMEIERDQVARVYSDASALLEPITPLEDLQIELDPGSPPARPLDDGARLGVERTSEPVPISDLLSTLDRDTRAFLSSLIASLDRGSRGRGPDMRRLLVALGPTTAQAGRITRALAGRRRELARLVHNLAVVTRAASRDDQLADVVAAGNRTLGALAEQDLPLRRAIAKLPPTLAVTRSTLVNLEPFARKLDPTLTALQPAVRRLPATFDALRPFAATGTRALRRDIRPLVREAQPLLRSAGPAVTSLSAAAPELTRSFQVLNYLFNELAYNPPGDDEGFLFWGSWFVHNWNSVFATGDAHGGIGRATQIVNCQGIGGRRQIQAALAVAGLCPE